MKLSDLNFDNMTLEEAVSAVSKCADAEPDEMSKWSLITLSKWLDELVMRREDRIP